MRNPVPGAAIVSAIAGLTVVLVSLPLVFLVHRALGLGSPPVMGLMLLGGTVIACFALAGALGAQVGTADGNSLLAALLGLVLGVTACAVMVPVYGGLVVDGLTHEATAMVWSERERLVNVARDAASAEERAKAAGRSRELAAQLAVEGKTKGVALLKSGASRTSALVLLLWAVIGSPFVAALSCVRVKA